MIAETFILIIVAGFICELIDSSLGMGYGTILTPMLILFGFPALAVVPAILITQAVGGIIASISHHRHGNADFHIKSKSPSYILQKIKEHGIIGAFNKGVSDDLKTAIIVTSFGIIATIIGVFIGVGISKKFINLYIGFLVLFMGLFILSNFRFNYSIGKMFIVGIISAFNKGLSGGGFGPVVTGGQMVLGKDHKKAIACTSASGPLICITGFISYLLFKGVSSWDIIGALLIGVAIAGLIGPITTKRINKSALKLSVAALMIILGVLTLVKTF